MIKPFDTAEPVRLFIRQTAGPVIVNAGEPGTSIVEIAGPNENDYNVSLKDGLLTVEAPKSLILFALRETTITVTVPAGSTVDISVGAGRVELVGAFGKGIVKTGAGDVNIDQAAGNTKVQTGAGSIRLGKVNAPTQASLGAGNITVGDVAANLDVAFGPGVFKVGRISRGNLTAKGTAGDMTIGVAPGVPTWTDLHTIGRISSTLPPVGTPAEGQDHIELRLTTAVGSITLLPA